MTAPTRGLGLVHPAPRRASPTARAMKRSSASAGSEPSASADCAPTSDDRTPPRAPSGTLRPPSIMPPFTKTPQDRGAPALQRALKHEVPGPLSIRAHAEDLLPSRLYCRSRNFTESALRLADFTAGRESHPALKMLCSCSTGRILRPFFPIVNYSNYFKWVKTQNPMATSSPEPTRPAGSASRPARCGWRRTGPNAPSARRRRR